MNKYVVNILILCVIGNNSQAQPNDYGHLEFVVADCFQKIEFERYGESDDFEIRTRNKKYTMNVDVIDRETGRKHSANYLFTTNETLNILRTRSDLRDFIITIACNYRQMVIEIRNLPPMYITTRISKIKFCEGDYILDAQPLFRAYNSKPGPFEIGTGDWSQYKVNKNK